MKRAFAPLFLLLAACSAPQPPAEAARPSPTEVAAAKRVPGQQATEPLWIFRASGTEPFWGVNAVGATLTYTTPDDPAGQAMTGTRRSIENGVEITGSHAGKPFALTVVAGDCNDGMSDNAYELVSTFRYGDIEYRGCGEAAK